MSINEFKFSNKTIAIEEIEDLGSKFKIKYYKQKIKKIEGSNKPQIPISEVLNDLFLKSKIISLKVKNSIFKIFYSSKDKIIIVITNFGNEFIWYREKLIQKYGWFFYVFKNENELKNLVNKNEKIEKVKKKETKKTKREDKKKEIIEEITLKVEKFLFENVEITLKQKENMRSLYNTKEYFQYLKIMQSKKIPQLPIKDVLNDLFFKNDLIPVKEKNSIKSVIYYEDKRVIVVKALVGDHLYENLENLVKKYGWYFYITGVPVGKSDISIAIDNVKKRYDSTYFKNISFVDELAQPKDIRITLYPIVLKPNHNSIILGIGKINILLDCGITEEYFDHIKSYLNNFDDLLADTEKNKNETKTIKEEKISIEEIDKLKNLDDMAPDLKEKNTNVSNEIKKHKIDAIFISHSHFDHISGLKDFIKLFPDTPILCSRITLDLYLLRDSNYLKQEKKDEIEEDYQNIVKNVIYVENGEKIEFKDNDCFLSFFHAGHMPGALMLLAKINDYRFLYTGDYTYWDITPFAGTRRFLDQISRPIDFLLIDASCAHEDFGDPSQQFHSLILFMEQKAEFGDNSLIGADPSSLAISFILILWRYFRKLQIKKDFKNRPNIYVDQMVLKNIQVINHRYEYIYGPISRLIRDKANPFNSIKIRWFDLDNLDFLRKKNNIIISHPPDLSYGIIRNIISVIGRNPHNLVYLSGAINEQPGQSLIEGANEIEFFETWKVPFRALLLNTFAPQLKIKLHGDKQQLTEMIKNLEPKEVCFFHQSYKKLIDVAEHAQNLGVQKLSVPIKRNIMILK